MGQEIGLYGEASFSTLRIDEVRCRNGRLRSGVWRYPGITRPGSVDALRLPPVGKPVALIADAVKDTTRQGDIVLDIFAGTGATVLAAVRSVPRTARMFLPPSRPIELVFTKFAELQRAQVAGKDQQNKKTGPKRAK